MSRPGRASVVPLTTCRRPPRCRVATSSSHTPAKCSKPGTGSSESRPRSHLTDTERAAPKETRPRLTCSSRTARTRPCRYEPTAPSATANRERGHDRKPSRDPYARGPEGQLAPQPPAWSILVRVRARVRDHRLHCSVCENVIGFYDPIVVLGPAGPRDTSLHDEPMLVTAPAVMHDRCVNSTDSGSPEH